MNALATSVHPSEPTLLPGAAADWPALRRWRPDALVAAVGDRQVPIEHYPDGPLGSDPGQFRTMTFAEYLTTVRNGAEYLYLADVRLHDVFPELSADVRPPRFLSGRPLRCLMFYGVDPFTQLHYHSQHQALLCQIIGEKRITLLHPSARNPLHPWYSDDFHMARHRERADDIIARTSPHEVVDVVVHPGDALTIPIGWLHVVEGTGWSASVTFFWRSWLDVLKASRHRPTLLASLALRTARRLRQ